MGPELLRIVMQPGGVIARHFHAGQAETLYILEGMFIGEGTAYPAGTELSVEAGTHHGTQIPCSNRLTICSTCTTEHLDVSVSAHVTTSARNQILPGLAAGPPCSAKYPTLTCPATTPRHSYIFNSLSGAHHGFVRDEVAGRE